MFDKRKSISTVFLLNMILVSFISISMFGLAMSVSEYLRFEQEKKEIEESFLQSQKAFIKNQVDQVIQYIEFERAATEKELKKDIKNKVYGAHGIAMSIYLENREQKSKAEIMQIIQDTLCIVQYGQDRGYYFLIDVSQAKELLAGESEHAGKNLLQVRDAQGKFIFKDMIGLTQQQGEGYYSYQWRKSDEPGDNYAKLVFVKRFETFNWLIGFVEHPEDVYADLKTDILNWIGKIRFGEYYDGYMFVFQFDGLYLMHLAKKYIGRNMIDVEDPTGFKINHKIVSLVKGEGGFLSYLWDRYSKGKLIQKMSYVKGIKDWEWVVGTGFYLDDLDEAINERKSVLEIHIRQQIVGIVFFLVFTFVLITFIARYYSKRFYHEFQSFRQFFIDAAEKMHTIDCNSLLFTEFQVLAENANCMVSKRRKAEDALVQARDTADAANRAKSEFLASMSHELRTPLNGILGYTQVLKRNDNLTEDQAQGLGIIQESGEHLLTMINDILDLSKIESGRLQLYPGRVNLSRFMDTIGSIIRMRANEKGIDFEYDAPSELPAGVYADEKRLRQVLLNLLGNAVKFTESGHITLRISQMEEVEADTPTVADLTSDKEQTALLHFEVEDTGIGISPDQQKIIFQPFEQEGQMKQREDGAGLGLAISRALVQAMGSELQVISEVGTGSLFRFDVRLPVVELSEASAEKGMQKITGYKGDNRSVLVVDDNSTNRSLLRRLMEPLGFNVTEAENGKEGIESARRLRPDMIIMDMRMPVMTGLEATSRIRQIEELRDTVILGFSASIFESDKNECLRAGCDGFLSKPLQVEEFYAVMRSHLGIEWIYAETDEEGAFGLKQEEDDDQAEIVAPPAEEMEALLDLAMSGDMAELLNQALLIEAIDTRYRAFGRALRELARHFEERKVLAMIKEYKV